MRLLLSVLMALTVLTSCSKEEKAIEDTTESIKEDFGPSPVDG